MDGGNFEPARYAGMRWDTPLSEQHAARLHERLDIGRRRRRADERLTEYVDVYRGGLGFTTSC